MNITMGNVASSSAERPLPRDFVAAANSRGGLGGEKRGSGLFTVLEVALVLL